MLWLRTMDVVIRSADGQGGYRGEEKGKEESFAHGDQVRRKRDEKTNDVDGKRGETRHNKSTRNATRRKRRQRKRKGVERKVIFFFLSTTPTRQDPHEQ